MKTYIIYEIKCNDENVTYNYIGSTVTFKSRKSQHKQTCNNENVKNYNLKLYKTIRENGGWMNWEMTALELFECGSKLEAHIREQYWIENKKSNLNSRKAHRSEEMKEYQKHYREQNVNEIKEYQKQYQKHYYEQNAETIKEQKKHYYEQNVNEIKEQKKHYREQNAETIKEQMKHYREQNADRIRTKNNEKFDCECGGKYTHTNKLRHMLSKKHTEFQKSNPECLANDD